MSQLRTLAAVRVELEIIQQNAASESKNVTLSASDRRAMSLVARLMGEIADRIPLQREGAIARALDEKLRA